MVINYNIIISQWSLNTEMTAAIVHFFSRQRVPKYLFFHGTYLYEICMSIVQHLWRSHYYDVTTYYIYYIIAAATDYD